MECGRLLTEAKAKVGHGNWLPWLEANFEFTPQWARSCIRLAERGAEIESAVSISAALKQIAAPKATTGSGSHRRVQHEHVEQELRRLFVRGEWRQPRGIPELDVIPDAPIAWAVLGVMLYHVNKAGAPTDFGYADLDEYVAERLPDVENAWRGLEFEWAVWAEEDRREHVR